MTSKGALVGGGGNPSPGISRDAYRKVQLELDRTQRHLAEIIDEVVFAEKQKRDAEDELESFKKEGSTMEQIVQNLIGYVIALENGVLIPAIDELSEVVPAGTVHERAKMFERMEQLRYVSARTVRLIAGLKAPSGANRERFRQRREHLMRHDDNSALNLDDVYALCSMLLDAKDELQLLLADTKERAAKLARNANNKNLDLGGNRGGSQQLLRGEPGSPEAKAAAQQREELQRQLEKARLDVEAVKKERDMLSKELTAATQSANVNPYQGLQQEYNIDKERLQRRIQELETETRKANSASAFSNQRVDVLQETIDQLQEEKRLLANDFRAFRRGQPTGAAADGGGGDNKRGGSGMSRGYEGEANRLRLELDALMRDHSSTVTKLEAQNATLRLELAEARQLSRPNVQEHYAQLQRTNELLRKDLVVLQQRLLSSNPRIHDPKASFDQKVQAFEITVSSLNTELEHMEEKIAILEKNATEERNQMVSGMDRERQQYQAEKEEYDTLMQKMVDEMDAIVKENSELKTRLRVLSEE